MKRRSVILASLMRRRALLEARKRRKIPKPLDNRYNPNIPPRRAGLLERLFGW